VTTAVRAKLAGDLDELRLLVGLTYRELARRSGCARSTLNDALTGRRFPRLDTVMAIVKACGGDVASWRERWVAAGRRVVVAQPEHGLEVLLDLLDLPPEQIVRAVTRWRRLGDQEPGTAPRMSRQSIRPS
jgi:transcriptional regulator with XRE-family HTH domain